MKVLVVGGDRIDTLKDMISSQMGSLEVLHWDGRKQSQGHRTIPQSVSYVIMLTTYLRHSVMKNIRTSAQRSGIPTVYSRHSSVDLQRCLECIQKDCSTCAGTVNSEKIKNQTVTVDVTILLISRG